MDPAAEAENLAVAFAAAWSAHDEIALGALFHDDADMVNVAGLWWHGRARIARVHGTSFRSYFASAALTIERMESRTLGPGSGMVRARVRLDGQVAPNGGPAATRKTMMLLIAGQSANGWRIQALQNTDIIDGAETMLATSAGHGGARYDGEIRR